MKKCRCKKCIKFRKTHDFEYLDIYGFYRTLAKYIYPRLVAFKENNFSFPCGLESKEWDKILDKMIFSFREINRGRYPKDPKKTKEGLTLFAEYFRDLWI